MIGNIVLTGDNVNVSNDDKTSLNTVLAKKANII
jgi:hypothetical protein